MLAMMSSKNKIFCEKQFEIRNAFFQLENFCLHFSMRPLMSKTISAVRGTTNMHVLKIRVRSHSYLKPRTSGFFSLHHQMMRKFKPSIKFRLIGLHLWHGSMVTFWLVNWTAMDQSKCQLTMLPLYFMSTPVSGCLVMENTKIMCSICRPQL